MVASVSESSVGFAQTGLLSSEWWEPFPRSHHNQLNSGLSDSETQTLNFHTIVLTLVISPSLPSPPGCGINRVHPLQHPGAGLGYGSPQVDSELAS